MEDSATPAHGQQVISACAFIYDDFDGVIKVFLPKRADTKKFLPGLYELPGGHIDFGEDIVEGLKREIKEEHGMSVTIGDPFSVSTYINQVKGSHSIQVNYFARFIEPIEQIRINVEDHSTFGWFSKDEVVELRNSIIPEGQVSHTYNDDPEYMTMMRGFELLDGKKLNFG